jgi:hypothetical protein
MISLTNNLNPNPLLLKKKIPTIHVLKKLALEQEEDKHCGKGAQNIILSLTSNN